MNDWRAEPDGDNVARRRSSFDRALAPQPPFTMRIAFVAAAAALLTLVPAHHAAAQGRWKEIGRTSAGNTVYVDPRSVKHEKGIITAVVRVKFTPPVKTSTGTMIASHTVAMFDCAKRTIAAKENTYYLDESRNRVADRTVNRIPGFGPALRGTLGDVALTYFCN